MPPINHNHDHHQPSINRNQPQPTTIKHCRNQTTPINPNKRNKTQHNTTRQQHNSNRRWCCGDQDHLDLSVFAFAKLADTKWGESVWVEFEIGMWICVGDEESTGLRWAKEAKNATHNTTQQTHPHTTNPLKQPTKQTHTHTTNPITNNNWHNKKTKGPSPSSTARSTAPRPPAPTPPLPPPRSPAPSPPRRRRPGSAPTPTGGAGSSPAAGGTGAWGRGARRTAAG